MTYDLKSFATEQDLFKPYVPIAKIHNEEEISRDYSIRWGSIAGSMSSSSNTGKNANVSQIAVFSIAFSIAVFSVASKLHHDLVRHCRLSIAIINR